MTMLAGVLSLYIVAIVIGKNIKKMNLTAYVFVGIIACLQVAFIFYMLYTMGFPEL